MTMTKVGSGTENIQGTCNIADYSGNFRVEIDYTATGNAEGDWRFYIQDYQNEVSFPIGTGTLSVDLYQVPTAGKLLIRSFNQAPAGATITVTGIRLIDRGNPATQATAAAQPKLITAGVTELENGKPALSFDGVDDELSADSNVFAASAYPSTKVCVYNSASVSTGVVSLSKDGDAATYSTLLQTNSTRANNTSRGLSGTSSVLGVANTDEQHIAFGFDASATDHNISVDGAAVVSDSTDTGEVAGVDKFLIGNWRNPSPAYHEGKIQEVIIYASDQSANRTILETNINDHYGIY